MLSSNITDIATAVEMMQWPAEHASHSYQPNTKKIHEIVTIAINSSVFVHDYV